MSEPEPTSTAPPGPSPARRDGAPAGSPPAVGAEMAWRPRQLPTVATLVIAMALGVTAATGVWTASAGADRLPLWDPAKYGLDGLRLEQAMAAGDLLEVLGRLHRMAVWPPVFPLLETPAFALSGPGYRSPEILVAVLFALLVAATAAAGVAAEKSGAGAAAGLLAAALVAASPLLQAHATIAMLEVPGALLTVVAFAAWARARRSGGRADARRAAIAATALFFLKTNYGVLWLAPLALDAGRERHGGLRPLGRALGAAIRALRWRRPGNLLLATAGLAVALFAVAARLGGGVDLSLGGLELRAHSPGNAVYGLYLLALLVAALRRREVAGWIRRRSTAATPLGRTFALWTAAPIAAWLALPPHLKEVVGFFENRSSGIPLLSLDALAFYPRVFVEDAAPSPAIGVAAALLVASALVRLRRATPTTRLLATAVVVDLGLMTLHGYKLDRFLLTALPLVSLLAAGEAVSLARAGHERLRVGPRLGAAVVAALALLAAAAIVAAGLDGERLRAARELRTAPASTAAALDVLATVDGPGLIVAGTWNGLSPALVEWHLRRDPARRRAAFPAFPGHRRALERALAGARPGDRLAILDVLPADDPWSAAFREETAWLAPLRSGLPGWTLERELEPAGSGYRWRVFRRDGVAEATGPAPAAGSAAGSSSPRSRS